MKKNLLLFLLPILLVFCHSRGKYSPAKQSSEETAQDQFEVERCNRSLAKNCNDERPGYKKCWFGTSQKNVYCCNNTAIGNRKPGKNDLFAPSICCVANGYKCFSGTLCCGEGCTKQGIPIPNVLGACSKSAPNDHVNVTFTPCTEELDYAVCRTDTRLKDHNKCFVATSRARAAPPLVAETCCNPANLKGDVPDTDEFVQIRSCCNPIGSLCLFNDNCCSGFCSGLENQFSSGFCAPIRAVQLQSKS